ncbi:hypothetical protein HDU98_008169 [Podochytrium sp. JEL0797]|nr:hypothetical protein HDU98_008169 [Podochytrium sp. JEL0797]
MNNALKYFKPQLATRAETPWLAKLAARLILGEAWHTAAEAAEPADAFYLISKSPNPITPTTAGTINMKVPQTSNMLCAVQPPAAAPNKLTDARICNTTFGSASAAEPTESWVDKIYKLIGQEKRETLDPGTTIIVHPIRARKIYDSNGQFTLAEPEIHSREEYHEKLSTVIKDVVRDGHLWTLAPQEKDKYTRFITLEWPNIVDLDDNAGNLMCNLGESVYRPNHFLYCSWRPFNHVYSIEAQFENMPKTMDLKITMKAAHGIKAETPTLVMATTMLELPILDRELSDYLGKPERRSNEELADYCAYQKVQEQLHILRSTTDPHELKDAIKKTIGFGRDFARMNDPDVYTHNRVYVDEFYSEVEHALERLLDVDSGHIKTEVLLEFLKDLKVKYGDTALGLSGGGVMGYVYEKAVFERGVRDNVGGTDPTFEKAHEYITEVLNLLPSCRLVNYATAIVSQTYSGDITIFHEFEASDYLNIISNPSKELVDKLVLNGQRATWPYIPFIRSQMRIEKAIAAAILVIEARLDAERRMEEAERQAMERMGPVDVEIPELEYGME